MAALVSTASALHFMVRFTLAFFTFWRVWLKKSFASIGTNGMNENYWCWILYFPFVGETSRQEVLWEKLNSKATVDTRVSVREEFFCWDVIQWHAEASIYWIKVQYLAQARFYWKDDTRLIRQGQIIPFWKLSSCGMIWYN